MVYPIAIATLYSYLKNKVVWKEKKFIKTNLAAYYQYFVCFLFYQITRMYSIYAINFILSLLEPTSRLTNEVIELEEFCGIAGYHQKFMFKWIIGCRIL